MTDYYSILGLTKGATDVEIKQAFRNLAKIYHPDKNPTNPDAKLLFENILKAYNTLIDPHSRRIYDTSGFHTTTLQAQKKRSSGKTEKEWTFTEEDLKRRQYYQNTYQAKKRNVVIESNPITQYNDYKYILFATPLAVGLLMLIISFFSETPKTKEPNKEKKELPEEVKPCVQLSNGYKPYSGYFGGIKTFETPNKLQINNSSVFGAVIVLLDNKNGTYLQHAYLQPSYSIEFSKLPDTGVYWKCILGKNWNENKILFNNKIIGGFDSVVQYQSWKEKPFLFDSEHSERLESLDVLSLTSKNKSYISNDIEFFEK